MGIYREHVHRGCPHAARASSASRVATTLVLRHALRLHLSSGVALWHRTAFTARGHLDSACVSSVHRVLLCSGNFRRLFAGVRRQPIARASVARISCHGALVACAYAHGEFSNRQPVLGAAAVACVGGLRRRAAHFLFVASRIRAGIVFLRASTMDTARVCGIRCFLRIRSRHQLLRRHCAGTLLPDSHLGYLARSAAAFGVAARRWNRSHGVRPVRLLANAILHAHYGVRHALGG